MEAAVHGPYTQNNITPILYNQTLIMSGLEQPVVALNVVNERQMGQ